MEARFCLQLSNEKFYNLHMTKHPFSDFSQDVKNQVEYNLVDKGSVMKPPVTEIEQSPIIKCLKISVETS